MSPIANLFLFAIIIAFLVAKLEINIEGKDGWAVNLPTRKIKNRLTKLVWGEVEITEYHVWFLILMQTFLHFPFLVGVSWTPILELQLQAMFLFATVLEDFLWFAMNPHYGLKKFNKLNAHWHREWLGVMPVFYLKLLLISAFFLATSLWI